MDVNEHNPEFTNSEEWKTLIANPRIKFYQLGKSDSVILGGENHYGKLHAKFIMADDIAFVGTSNFDFRSILFNSEKLRAQSYLWGSKDWLNLRLKIRQAGGAKGFTTKTQRSMYKTLEKTGLKIQL